MASTRQIYFPKALIGTSWQNDVIFEIDQETIIKIDSGVPSVGEAVETSDGYAIPGMVNVHSHAFQRAFSGLSEYRSAEQDSFWTWRNLMYEFLQTLTPEDAYSIALDLYQEMLAGGYTSVGEFHYLHHQPNGEPYPKSTAMADAVIRAALDAGINICMLPVLYQRGGFDNRPLVDGQLRFGSSNELFLKMMKQLQADWGQHPNVRLGVALHSLRAVCVDAAREVLREVDRWLPGCPIHIHVAEQTEEVEACLAATGQRPVEFLLDSFDVNERWCLIHATHMTDEECRHVSECGAVVGVCPTTEANLGDGVFMAEAFLKQGGRLAIGSDSHISIDACSELRMLEYAQRLTKRRRAILCTDTESCGNLLYRWAMEGGALVIGFGNGSLQVGNPARFVVLNAQHASVRGKPDNRLLDTMIFSELPTLPVREPK